jgi:hypothetical protein
MKHNARGTIVRTYTCMIVYALILYMIEQGFKEISLFKFDLKSSLSMLILI